MQSIPMLVVLPLIVYPKTLGVLGLSFKPETDDMRELPALTILPALIEKGAKIRVYDPEAYPEVGSVEIEGLTCWTCFI